MPDLNVFPILIAVANYLNVTKAAESLSMTKSAVSKAIQGVEDKLGVRLFHRTTRSISLTEAGSIYINYVKKSYSLALMANDSVSEFSDMTKGKIKISAPMSFGTLHLSKILPLFMLQHPELEIELLLEDKVTDLVSEGYDIAVRIGELPDSSLIARMLSPCTSMLCASVDYLDKQGEPTNVTELKQHNCLTYSLYQAGQEWIFYHKKSKYSHIPKGTFKANNSESLMEAVIQGVGIALLPNFIAMPFIQSKKIKPILTSYHLPEHAIYAVYPNKEHLPKKLTLLIDFLINNFGDNSEYRSVFESNKLNAKNK